MNALELRVVPLSDLRPAPYNPRRELSPRSAAYRKLKASLAEFGLVEPLVWNESSGHVVGGHARLRILADLGVTEVPVSVVRLSDAREKALNVVLNNLEAQSRYDPSKLADLLDDLNELPELEMTGFDQTMLETLRFEPVGLPQSSSNQVLDRVEVTLVTDTATFERLQSELDGLIHRFDLVAHVNRTGDEAPPP